MKKILAVLALLIAGTAFAQNQQVLNDGLNYARSIAPTQNGQIVNPGAVNSSAWSSTNIPGSAPTGMGAFSKPVNTSSYGNANVLGSLTVMGTKSQADCATYVPTGDVVEDQRCAAINFMAAHCLTPTSGQNKIIAASAASQGSLANCKGTYGSGQGQFDYGNQITEKDPVFDVVRGVKDNPDKTTGGSCTEQDAVTNPAEYAMNNCTKSSNVVTESCSQSLSATITTTSQAANVGYSCANGTQVGSFCQATDSTTVPIVYGCPAGYTLSGNTCTGTDTKSATPNYYCPVGSTLSGTNCIDGSGKVTPAPTNGYSCPSGYTLSGQTCSMTQTVPAVQAGYGCPAGSTLVGTQCVAGSQVSDPVANQKLCPDGFTLNNGTCVGIASAAAQPVYSCPSGGSLTAGHTCVAQTSVPMTTQSAPDAPGCVLAFNDPSTCDWNNIGNNVVLWPPDGDPNNPYDFCPSFDGWTFVEKSLVEIHHPWADVWLGHCTYKRQVTYSCPAGSVQSGSQCITTTTTTASLGYQCPAGQVLNGTTCRSTSVTNTTATSTYTCSGAVNAAGTNCQYTVTSSTGATPNYSCEAGFTLSGTNCLGTVVEAATPVYTCPAGSTLFNKQCTDGTGKVTNAAIASYSCPDGFTLSGTTCTQLGQKPATVSYSCPAGSTLQGTNCITVTTVPAAANYSCADGSAPQGNVCVYRTVRSSWVSTCGDLETSAGSKLGAPT
ncbi:hypothetical protein [Herbaspirillum huttiense]|uniref:hypothetical protein n=1 Tax=Herbaspirillum huttiense TaxID=863372 RepID=UPI002176CB12|nr:hypothetical protein [Herbaspirillum huttiense]UWE19398.1 hypothetical protein NY669_26850 [Herbaspirillum huttiense]